MITTKLKGSTTVPNELPLLAAFAHSDDVVAQLRQVGAQLSRYQQHISSGGVPAAIEFCRARRSPDLLVIDISAEADALYALDQLANYCEAHTRVIVLGVYNDISFYQRMRQLGVNEYLTLPLEADRYQHAVLVAFGEQPLSDQSHGKKVALYGCRGGVGVTTLAANLAWHLADKERVATAVLDLDMRQGDLDLLLGFTAGDRLERVMTRPDDLDDVQLLERAGEKLADRLSAYKSRYCSQSADLSVTRQRIHQLCELNSRVILDLPRSQPELTHVLLAESELRVILLEPGLSALRDATDVLQQLGSDAPGQRTVIVLNHTRPEKHCMINQAQIEQALQRPINFVLPWQPDKTTQAQDLGVPLINQSSKLSQQIAALAHDLLGNKAVQKKQHPFGALLERFYVRT